MLDKINYLETETEKFPLVFTLNVMESIQEKYGTIEACSNMLQRGDEPDIKALKFFVTEAINEGIEIEMVRSVPRPVGDAGVLTNRKKHRVLQVVVAKTTMFLTGKPAQNQPQLKRLSES